MVVILIIAMLLWLGSFGGLFSRRENARIEELAVNIIGLIDIEKTNALLGKTEWGAIVRKRKITLDISTPGTIRYNSYADLAEDTEDSYCSASANCDVPVTTPPNTPNTPLVTKEWTLANMATTLWKCTNGTAIVLSATDLYIVMTGDAMAITTTPASTEPHLVLQIARGALAYREIHIDRRTGLTYEKAGLGLVANPSCL